jgi:hypothetical protein
VLQFLSNNTFPGGIVRDVMHFKEQLTFATPAFKTIPDKYAPPDFPMVIVIQAQRVVAFAAPFML